MKGSVSSEDTCPGAQFTAGEGSVPSHAEQRKAESRGQAKACASQQNPTGVQFPVFWETEGSLMRKGRLFWGQGCL